MADSPGSGLTPVRPNIRPHRSDNATGTADVVYSTRSYKSTIQEVYAMAKTGTLGVCMFLCVSLFCGPLHAGFTVDLESGAVFSGYNDVRIPGDTGTLFSLSEDLDPETSVFFRARLRYAVGDRGDLSILIAPLKIQAEGRVGKDIDFEGKTFPADQPLDATYRFNSYRLTYRYDLYETPGLELGLGLTAKIRDAEIRLTSGDIESKKSNVGFVPLLNFRLLWSLGQRVSLLVDGDALAAPQGRAEDVLAALRYRISDRLAIKAGYRILEGGADNDEVYNFTLLNYAVIGLTLLL
jgi:hypothetical protein